MKTKAIILFLAILLVAPVLIVRAATTSSNLKGKILIQVESKGEAWYVNPKDGLRYYLANGDEALKIMKKLGVGVNNRDISRIKTDASFRKKFIGKILLQVESHGEAYYISSDGRYNYLKDGAAAFAIMKKLGIGISNANLNKITSTCLDSNSGMILFTGDNCPHCKNVEDYILQNKIQSKLSFQELEVYNNIANSKLLTEKTKQCNLSSLGVPLFFDGKNCIQGDNLIIDFLSAKVQPAVVNNPKGPMISYKPVIYLYPTTKQIVKLNIDYKGKFIVTYPEYNNGWNVTAYPDGKIVNNIDGKEYSYLFWEGIFDENVNYNQSAGFIVAGKDTANFLQNKLQEFGLTPKEYNEFIVYWLPQMLNNEFNLIHFATKAEYDDKAVLNITPKPDSVLRVFMTFKKLDNKISVFPQVIKPFVRTGFSVVEWGGTEIK